MAGFGSAPTSPLPTVGVTIGPSWASQLNTALLELQTIVTPRLGNAQIDLGTDADVKHGTRTVYYHAGAGQPTGTSAFTGGSSMYWQGAAAGDTVVVPLEQAINERITAVSVYGRANGATAWTWKLYSVNLLSGVVTQVGSTQTSATAAEIGRAHV